MLFICVFIYMEQGLVVTLIRLNFFGDPRISLDFRYRYRCFDTENCSVVTYILTLSDLLSDLVRHYDFPVPDAFLDL
jgi:hypothetical protein